MNTQSYSFFLPQYGCLAILSHIQLSGCSSRYVTRAVISLSSGRSVVTVFHEHHKFHVDFFRHFQNSVLETRFNTIHVKYSFLASYWLASSDEITLILIPWWHRTSMGETIWTISNRIMDENSSRPDSASLTIPFWVPFCLALTILFSISSTSKADFEEYDCNLTRFMIRDDTRKMEES